MTDTVGLTLTLEDPVSHEPRSFMLDSGLIAILANMIIPPLLTAGLNAIPNDVAPQVKPAILAAGNTMVAWANAH